MTKRQITVPVEIRRQPGLKSGDNILFLQKQNGESVVSNASAAAIQKAQAAFAGAADALGVSSEMIFRCLSTKRVTERDAKMVSFRPKFGDGWFRQLLELDGGVVDIPAVI